ncbi:MAG: MCE family protein [Gordonia amarae]
MRRRIACLAALVVAVLSVASCGWQGIESVQMPGGAGRGDGAFSVVIEMPDVTTISVNSPVLVGDVEVGRITSITLRDWHARVKVRLNGGVDLPKNATAAIGQTSLLGSQHISLSAPKDGANPARLADGDVIGLDRSTQYPTTEQTLSALSVIVNGGGLAQVGDIVNGANEILGGRTDRMRILLTQLSTLTTTIDRRRTAITTALSGLDRIAGSMAAENQALDTSISRITPAVKQLSERRSQLDDALTSLDRFGTAANSLITRSAADLKSNIASLHPTLKALADTGKSLTNSLDFMFTLPFPISRLDRVVRGDFANLYALLDFSVPRVRSDLLRDTPLGRTLAGPTGVLGKNAGTAADRSDPRTDPITRAPAKKKTTKKTAAQRGGR